jgi:hypothetical protein
MEKNYLLINQSTNIVDNVIVWNGDVNTWQPPSGYLLLEQDTTPSMYWNEVIVDGVVVDWVLETVMGLGQINFTWNGAACITDQPKPPIPTPPSPEPTV